VDETLFRTRQAASQRGFYRALGAGSPGARVLEPAPGVQATVVPVREWFSIFNSVLYSDRDALLGSLPQLAEGYAEAGVKAWSVWVPPADSACADALERAGHTREGNPMLMAAEIDALDLQPRVDIDADAEASWEEVARCNDRAYEVLDEWTMADVVEAMDDPATRRYAVHEDGQAVAALLAREHDGDCYFWFVATAPEAQRRGIASELMRIALRAARERGCTSTTLESTSMAEPVYARLGFQPLGRYGRWERRAAG
jgi:ribosomal protein S18 acetylase RimI-like enzyme